MTAAELLALLQRLIREDRRMAEATVVLTIGSRFEVPARHVHPYAKTASGQLMVELS